MPKACLVLAPGGRDCEVIRLVLDTVGIATRACSDLAEVCANLTADALALLVTEGALEAGLDDLIRCLDAQPPWSDIPILVLTYRGARPGNPARVQLFERLGNVTLLDRPLRAESLRSAALAAVRARGRQYRTRAHLKEIEQAAAVLEKRVDDATRDLQEEMAERRKVEEVLRQTQKMEALGQLTGGVAHDFNNLLQAIRGNLELLERRVAEGRIDVGKQTQSAIMAVDRAAALTQRLLAFSRRQALNPKALDLNALVAGMLDLIEHSVGDSVRVSLELAEGLWPTWADAGQVEVALLNLAVNARDAQPEGGQLTIRTANVELANVELANVELGGAAIADEGEMKPGAYVMLAMTDGGTGMPPEVSRRAFDPFFTTKPLGHGTGLGLSQVYGFTRQSGGYVRIDSAVGCGTTVYLYLPRYDGPEPAGVVVVPAEAERGEHKGGTVLVVEDEGLVRMMLVSTLEDEGYRVLEASDAEEALTILESSEPVDLLATDVGLPGLNGRQLVERGRDHRPCLKVLFLTGYAHDAVLDGELLKSGTELLTKPIEMERFLAIVQSMLEEPCVKRF